MTTSLVDIMSELKDLRQMLTPLPVNFITGPAAYRNYAQIVEEELKHLNEVNGTRKADIATADIFHVCTFTGAPYPTKAHVLPHSEEGGLERLHVWCRAVSNEFRGDRQARANRRCRVDNLVFLDWSLHRGHFEPECQFRMTVMPTRATLREMALGLENFFAAREGDGTFDPSTFEPWGVVESTSSKRLHVPRPTALVSSC